MALRIMALLVLAALWRAASAQTAPAVTRTYLGETVTITRDAYGIPYITAKTMPGACYGNGYAIAEDRLGQMDLNRRAARGEMAELVGASALAADRETRTDGYTEEEREAQFQRLPEELRAMMTAYAAGVNDCLRDAQDRGKRLMVANYPGAADGLDPATVRPWKVTDTVAIGQMMARRFGGDEGGELRNMLVLSFLQNAHKKDAYRLFNDALWRNDPSSPTTIPPGEDGKPWPGKPHWADPTGKPIAFDAGAVRRAADVVSQKARLELAQRLGLMTKWGSYCMAVAARKSATGNAMLVGGPQMGFRTPQIAHEVGLSAGGVDVAGMGFPGIPGVLIGRNRYLAWSTTTGVNDQTDIFVETLNPADPMQYRFKGEWRRVERRVEIIKVRGAAAVEHECFRTVHGPVVQWDKSNNKAYARMSTYWDRELETFEAIGAMARARTVGEYGKACALIPTSHNWLCATQSGDIGFWFCGQTPIRAAGIDPRLPTPGDGSKEWRGILPFEKMPHIVNPKQGFAANWNNKPATWWDNGDTPVWGEVFHNGRIAQLLAARPKIAPEDLRSILLDIGTNDYAAQMLLPVMLGALRTAPPALRATLTPASRQAVGYLEAWDCHATEGSVAKTLFDAWLQAVREELFNKPFGFIKLQGIGMFNLAVQPSLILHVLKGPKSTVPVQYDYFGKRTPAQVVAKCLNDATARLARESGPHMAAWRFSRGNINFTPLPPIPSTDRGTYIQIVECAKTGPTGVSILPPGQSERTDSPHFSDQRELAGWFFFKPMPVAPK